MPEPLGKDRRQLLCVECGKQADEWRAYLTSDEPEEVATFCPECAEREFEPE